MATKTSHIPRNLNFLGETAFLGGIFCLEYPSRRSEKVNCHFVNYRLSFRKLQIVISQTADFHFANYIFSFRKEISRHFKGKEGRNPTKNNNNQIEKAKQKNRRYLCGSLKTVHLLLTSQTVNCHVEHLHFRFEVFLLQTALLNC